MLGNAHKMLKKLPHYMNAVAAVHTNIFRVITVTRNHALTYPYKMMNVILTTINIYQ
jgi:hypothetical protein